MIGKCIRRKICSAVILSLFLGSSALAVNSKTIKHSSREDFEKGKTINTVIDSKGTISLAQAAELLYTAEEDLWSINCITSANGKLYFGSSPNGKIYEYSMGQIVEVYSSAKKPDPNAANSDQTKQVTDADITSDAAQQKEPKKKNNATIITNEHIFAMGTDLSGRLLAAISGPKARLCRFDSDKFETIYQEDANGVTYIFDIALDADGNIYLATGPKGKIIKLVNDGEKAEVFFDSKDDNILTIAIKDGILYAGSDGRGLIYKISLQDASASVLYDSDQDEITDIVIADDNVLYVTATSAKLVAEQNKFVAELANPTGRPADGDNKAKKSDINIPNIADEKEEKTKGDKDEDAKKPSTTPSVSYLFKIDQNGFVTGLLQEKAIFFAACPSSDNGLFIATGNDGKLLKADLENEKYKVAYKDNEISQITALFAVGDDLYVGSANPAKLIKLSSSYAATGIYKSNLIDAAQPARWGKLQIEADVPDKCKISVSCRSGNVDDINDVTFSDWTLPVKIEKPVQLLCPVGRYCQYKLILNSQTVTVTPVVKGVVVASTVDNLPPKIESINVKRIDDGLFEIKYEAKDGNDDKLQYEIDIKNIRWNKWITIKDKIDKDEYKFDGKTVEDGRYEIRVSASDENSNTSLTKLTASRISDQVIIDNTRCEITNDFIDISNDGFNLTFTVTDKLSIIDKVEYVVDSCDKWNGLLPEDKVYDTTTEEFYLTKGKLKAGSHIVTIRAFDCSKNAIYKTYHFDVVGQ